MKYVVGAAVIITIAASATDWIKGALVALGFVVAYILLALIRPHKPCRRCGGTLRSKRWFGVFGKVGACQKCKGRKRHVRFGAKHVHQFFQSVVGRDAGQPQVEAKVTKGVRNVSDRWASVPEQRWQGDGQQHGRG